MRTEAPAGSVPASVMRAAEPAAGPRFVRSLSSRAVLLCVVVALVAAVVTIGVSIPLINGAARAQAQATLDRLADVTVEALQEFSPVRSRQLLNDLQVTQGVTSILIGRDLSPAPGLAPSVQRAVISGTPVSTTAVVNGQDYFVSARPINGVYGLVLYAPGETALEPAAAGLRRLIAALVAGVVVASIIGYVASRRVTRPLRQFSRTAQELSAGRRDINVEITGPAEIAEIAASLNQLSRALATSEGRQREFLLSVSHELRTPLTAVRGYAEALSDGLVASEDVPATAEVMQSEAARLDRLVADLLDLARLGAVDFTINLVDVDLTDLAREAADVWADRCEREGVSFVAEIPDEPLAVRTDPVRARQVIDNLAENALRVTPVDERIVLSVAAAGEQAAVTVRDSGPGLSPEDRAVAFEPAALYARYRGVRPVGSGVGLALVGRLAARLGGSAYVTTAPEGGAAFGVCLPRAGSHPASAS